MSGFIRQIKLNDGTPITPPSTVNTSAASWEVFADDASYEGVYGTGEQGDCYFNSTELLLRVHNGTEWVYLQNGINSLEDNTSSGSNIDLDSTYHNLLKLTNAGVVSCRSLDPAQTLICYLVNDTGNDISLLHDDAGATAANRLLLPGSTAFTLTSGNVAHFVYDSIASRWRYTNSPGEGGGSGTGTGDKNYVLGPDDSSNVTSLGGMIASDTVTASELPEETKGIGCKVTITAGSPGDNLTWTVDSIDDGDGDRIGTNSFYYKTLPGYVDDDFKVFWKSSTGPTFGETNIKAGSGFISGSDITLIAGADINPILESNVATSSGIVVSGVGVLAQNPLVGAVVTDWQAYTPTNTQGLGTITSRLQWRQNGNCVEIKGDLTTGTVTASETQIELPNSYTIDYQSSVDSTVVGYYERNVSDSLIFRFPVLATNGDTFFNLGVDNTSLASNPLVPISSTSTFIGATERASFFASVPVAELSGTTKFGSDLEAQNARARYYRNAAYNYVSGDFAYDTTSTRYPETFISNNGSGVFSFNSDGLYEVEVGITAGAAFTGAFSLYKNGSFDSFFGKGTGDAQHFCSGVIQLLSTDTLSIRCATAISTVTTGDANTFINIRKVSDKSSALTGFPLSTAATADLQYLVPEYRETTITLVNDGAQNMNGTVKFTRIGNVVTYHSDGPITHTSASSIVSATLVPVDFRPTNNLAINTYFYQDFGFSSYINSTGTIEVIYRDEAGSGIAQTSTNQGIGGTYIVF